MGNAAHENLKDKYPEYISLNQLYQICRICKRSAVYLVQNGIIPCIDSGKKTRRYKIALDDVISYLQKREVFGSMIPTGFATSRYKRPSNPRKSFATHVLHDGGQEITDYFRFIFTEYPEVLTVKDIVEMTGLCEGTILSFIRDGYLKVLGSKSQYIIPKAYLLEFLASERFIECKSYAQSFKRVLGGFELWKTAKSLQ